MPFSEPRPHRRPFNVHANGQLDSTSVAPKTRGGNLAITSFTAASQSGDRTIRVTSNKDDDEQVLLEVYVPGGQTIHLSFPHPILVGVDRTLVMTSLRTGAFLWTTVVGYEWNQKDATTFIFGVGELVTDLFRRKDG